jgi:hypothetical protein
MAQLLAETDVEKKKMKADYDASKETVIGMLLHQITTSEVKLSDSEIQAFLAIARSKEARTNPEDEY